MLNSHLVELSEVAYNMVSFVVIGLCFLGVTKDFIKTLKAQEYDKDGN